MARKKDVIDPLLEEVLYELIAEKINAIPPAEAEETVKKLQAFLQCNAYRNQQKRITIASLVDLLQIMEIRIIDLYEAAGIKVSWPNEKSETFNLHLKKLSDAEKIKIRSIIADLSPKFWQHKSPELSTPTKRMLFVLQHKYSRTDDMRAAVLACLGEEAQRVWLDHKHCTTISLLSLPEIAAKLEISLHWLLGLGNRATILADDSISEDCVTGYLFLNPFGRATIDMLVEDLESR